MPCKTPALCRDFAPVADSALWTFGNFVPGRDAERDCATEYSPQLTSHVPDWPQQVVAAANYGLHATLKASISLAAGTDEI